MALPEIEFAFAPYRLSGVVVGCLLNHAPALAALGDVVHAPPYKSPPRAPVLYVHPRNALGVGSAPVAVPADAAELELGAALGLVIGRTACRVREADALAHLAGGVIVAELCVPHQSFYRPSVRMKARDGFCRLGPHVVPRVVPPAAPDALGVRVFVDGALVQQSTTGDRVRGAARLLADVSDFMTLSPGDVLVMGVSAGAPRVRAGQHARVEIDGLGSLTLGFAAEEATA